MADTTFSSEFPEQPPDAGSIIPSSDEPFPPSETLDAIERNLEDPSLFGDTLAPEDGIDLDEEPVILGRSWSFDFVAKRFVTGGGNAPMHIDGMLTLQQWAQKALLSQRRALYIHSDDYGMDDPFGMIGKPFDPAMAGSYETQVRDALTFHPKIEDVLVVNVRVDPEDEEVVLVDVEVQLDDDEVLVFESLRTR